MPAKSFMVTTTCPNGSRSQTRFQPSSAMVLADRWAQGGCSSIVLTDPSGTTWQPEAFRARLPQMKKLIGAFT